jgi:signal-transduction protein with cAMP-binding, CBS, and nucleotidyltransferase domain
MRVADIMSYCPVTVDAFDSIEVAAQHMHRHAVGILPVLERGHLVGVVTDRDLAIRAVAHGRQPWDTHVREVMTHDAITCAVEAPVETAAAQMTTARLRRLIVVSDDGQPCGVLSIDDLVLNQDTRALAIQAFIQVALLPGERDRLAPWA